MAEAFMGEIRLFGGNYAPVHWALCNGQLMSINNYQALFSLLGTAYGGDGRTSFALPDLRGRIPVGIGHRTGGDNWVQGQRRGIEAAALTVAQMPSHNHAFQVSDDQAYLTSPGGTVVGRGLHYVESGKEKANGKGTLAPEAVTDAGEGEPHSNMMPYTGLNYIICLVGTYPPRN